MVLEEHPDKQIAVVNSRSTGPKVALMARRAVELLQKKPQMPFDEAVAQVERCCESLHTVFSLSRCV